MAKPHRPRAEVLPREDANSDRDLRHGALVGVSRISTGRLAQRVADPQPAGHPHQCRPVTVTPQALVADHALERHTNGGAGHQQKQAGVELARVADVLGQVQTEVGVPGQRQGALTDDGRDVVPDARVGLGQAGRGQPRIPAERLRVVAAGATEFDDPQDHPCRDGSHPHAVTISSDERLNGGTDLSRRRRRRRRTCPCCCRTWGRCTPERRQRS